MKTQINTIINEVSEIHPYKQRGNVNSYSEYNEGWADACDIIAQNIDNYLTNLHTMNKAIPQEALNLLGNGFFTKYYEFARTAKTNKDAYEQTENLYIEYFTRPRYSNYDSFRKSINKRLKK